jgi:hypothetical protein
MRADHERAATNRSGPETDGLGPDDDRTTPGPETGRSDLSQPDLDRAASGYRVTVQEAADALGISVEAVRARMKRGTLRKEKAADGTVYVWLDADQTPPNFDRPRQDDPRTGDQIADRAQPDAALLEALRDQIEMLRTELEDRKEEARRKDAIIMSLSQRIPELEAPSEPREASETAAEDASKGDVPPEPQEPARRRSWLYRFFYGP